MKDWFQNLAPREQVLISIGGILVIILVIVTLGIQPILSKATRGRELISEKQALLNELSQVAERIGPQSGSGQAVSVTGGQSLVVVVDKTTRERGLGPHLKRNQPDGENSIRLRFENASFDTLMVWLSQLQNQYGLTTTSANIDIATGTGRVNCNLTLERTGA
jgi:general secretion pathway protein M